MLPTVSMTARRTDGGGASVVKHSLWAHKKYAPVVGINYYPIEPINLIHQINLIPPTHLPKKNNIPKALNCQNDQLHLFPIRKKSVLEQQKTNDLNRDDPISVTPGFQRKKYLRLLVPVFAWA